MSERIDRVARAIAKLSFPNHDWEPGSGACLNEYQRIMYRCYAVAAISALRPEFEALAKAYSPQGDDWVWVDERTPISQFVDSIINDLDLQKDQRDD